MTFALLVAAAGCSAVAPTVDRVADGTTEHGRYISYLSYAAYAQAAELEAVGQFEAAEEFYQSAMKYDPDSWEIWTRLGSVRCALKRPDASQAFSRAEALAPDSASLWLSEARCELSKGHAARALELAKRSLRLDPNHPETTRLISEALRALGREKEARRWLVALAARHPGSPAALIWLSGKGAAGEDAPLPAVHRVDSALLGEQPELASARALRLGLSEAELAAREVALGLTRQGFERAKTVLEADPSDGTAWVVVAVAADLLGREDEYQRVVAIDTELGPLDELSTLLFADLLKRRAGRAAARAWLEHATPSPSTVTDAAVSEDSLTAFVRARLETELIR